MTDFQTAMTLAGAIVLLAALVLIFQPRRPATVRPAETASGGSSALPADLAAMEGKIKAVEGRLSEVEHGVNQVRTMMNALPTKDSVQHIALQVAELKGDLKANNVTTAATAKGVEKMMGWMMEEAIAKKDASA